ncbi:elongation factor P--(R)-beta-lysine ligase [Colwellia sp. 1_MG-2023]|jgi:lysyl-tRNA synthetase class 2|uniref:elongation factor P--(R)-beta-lysine ligase n=1 Tax=unclassified Colwellia TaxID=196834 RepID=UPI001C08CDEE|nr:MULTISPECIES: elongation factor P--(R)-beta-lysine ligase [unclassified Colwellia]MBU2924210.1 elongation factor P--(R)-beta-lysine ligase [Colwellia sp. C2M11]MDO6652129.1 elongation factor P--(R)-beta-lysine ligase [Colwellia sp. 3_MG-2023]MDO6664905.1 elongation factor P--(R)-beta-lysine ligase [Colwellia sp. 2_MG-2023]MDO6689053.1 elongation factor P--(R)-beta-lysine ligase [Colwellia sp. 1_MG-2023]
MSWQSTLSWENAQKRAKILQQIRNFFAERNVLEVETPSLSQATVTDVHLEGLSCRYNFLADSPINQAIPLYLQTSPEFHMKRLLASGYGCIFQIAKAFRHEAFGKYHNPEFTLLEWYRINFDHFDLMAEVGELLKTTLHCAEPIKKTYQELFIEYTALDPLTASRDDLLTVISRNNKLSDWLVNEDDNDILLQFIFCEIIEPVIGQNEPCFVYNFPSSQASLAKLCPDDNRVAQRFECYYQGIELVNGFNELTSHETQVQRFQEDNKKRAVLSLPEKVIDENFISALSHGLPQCAGVALGVDRLIMLALKIEHIEQVITFPIGSA